MGVTLIYKSEEVGPVCQRISKAAVNAGLEAFKVAKAGAPNKVMVRWGTVADIQAPAGSTLINSYDGVVLARNKKKSRQLLSALSPKTWFTYETLHYPCVIRPRKHHAAHKFFVCSNALEAKKAIKACGFGWYGSELINKAREFRVFTLHGRIVAVSERFPGNSHTVAWNLAVGGKLLNVKRGSWPISVLGPAVEATKLLGLDFSAVDLAIESGTNKVVVFEVNTAPGLRNPYTLACIAKAFAWVEDHTLPTAGKGTKWTTWVHPAIKSGE